ncbi:MAG: sel1 repeat family protein [Gammaproteobacteria bacterium]|nr:sel1 repeat family protein [Gammaproteobacteria bacterium]
MTQQKNASFASAGLFTGVLIALGLLLWQLPKISSYDLGAPVFVVYVLVSLFAAGITFGVLRGYGSLKGEKFGLAIEFGGAASMCLIVLLAGMLFEGKESDVFEITVYFHEEGKQTKLVKTSGTATLLLDEPKKDSTTKGYVVFSKIPAKNLGENISLSVDVDGYEANPLNEAFERSKRIYVALKKKVSRNNTHQETEKELLKKAAENGDVNAQATLGKAYLEGEKGLPTDYRKAYKLTEKAAMQGHPEAQNNLGVMHAKGWFVSQDYEKAAKWYKKSAEQKNPVAQVNLAGLYAKGLGVKKNEKKAAKLIRSATEHGDFTGLSSLALSGSKSIIADDIQEWVKLLLNLAEEGDVDAQFNLGVIYGEGRSLQKDIQQAIEWLCKAGNQGHNEAKRRLQKIYDKELSACQIREGGSKKLKTFGRRDKLEDFVDKNGVQAGGTALPVTVSVELNKYAYQNGDQFYLVVNTNSDPTNTNLYDLYVGFLLLSRVYYFTSDLGCPNRLKSIGRFLDHGIELICP